MNSDHGQRHPSFVQRRLDRAITANFVLLSSLRAVDVPCPITSESRAGGLLNVSAC